MKIISKNGTEITLEISGTQEETKIIAEKFTIVGKKVYGDAVLCDHYGKKGSSEYNSTEAGLLFWTAQKTYVQCAEAMPAIQGAIAALPHKEYWARKVQDTVDADGDICTVHVWEFDKVLKTEKTTWITETEMGLFLDSKTITEIKIDDAVQLWADEKEETHLKAEEKGNARAKAMFEADEAEEGYDQACENAGIPSFMR